MLHLTYIESECLWCCPFDGKLSPVKLEIHLVCQPKVTNLGYPLLTNEDITGSKVSVHYFLRFQICHPTACVTATKINIIYNVHTCITEAPPNSLIALVEAKRFTAGCISSTNTFSFSHNNMQEIQKA